MVRFNYYCWYFVFNTIFGNPFKNDKHVINDLKIGLELYKKNQLKQVNHTKDINLIFIESMKKIFFNYKQYNILGYIINEKQWKTLDNVDKFFLINSNFSKHISDLLTIKFFIEKNNIGSYDESQEYLFIYMTNDQLTKDFKTNKPYLNIEYKNIGSIKKKLVSTFIPSIDKEYESIIQYDNKKEKLFIKNINYCLYLKKLVESIGDKQIDDGLLLKGIAKLNLIFCGEFTNNNINYDVYASNYNDNKKTILFFVNLKTNDISILIETIDKGTFSTSINKVILPNINNIEKYN